MDTPFGLLVARGGKHKSRQFDSRRQSQIRGEQQAILLASSPPVRSLVDKAARLGSDLGEAPVEHQSLAWRLPCVCGLFAATFERGWRWTEECVWLLGALGVRLSLQRQMATQSSAGDDVVICNQEQEKMSSKFSTDGRKPGRVTGD